MFMIKGTIKVDTDRCKGCNLCAVACPKKIITLSETVNRMGYHYAQQSDNDACTGCAACGIMCPDGCITVFRERL
ncbi:MAG: ferredoxin family protein [Bacteroidales bacterium]|nr:ferredoxin family protein [Candidatus Liminaster caballi]